MNPAYAFNTFLGPALVIALIFAECAGKYSSNTKQKRLLCGFLIAAFVLLIIDLTFSLLPNPAKIIWYCIAALFLYIYFNNVKNETRIDALTGLGNRYSFNEFTGRLSRQKAGESWVIVMIDLEHTKEINSTHGYLEGDNAIRELAAVIKSCIRKTVFAARYGGDEFVIATKVKYGIEGILKKIKEELASYNEKIGKPYKIEISYGFDIYTTGSRQIEEFLNHVDGLMDKHKEERRVEDTVNGGTA
jgi:diguanylate cyclase (GGDEF)-like protein